MKKSLSKDVNLWIAPVDPELNEMSYIVTGLRDLVDLVFGTKLQH